MQDGTSDPHLQAEALGCLAALDLDAQDFAPLLESTRLAEHLHTLMLTPDTLRPLLLRAIAATGVLCSSQRAALVLVNAGLVRAQPSAPAGRHSALGGQLGMQECCCSC